MNDSEILAKSNPQKSLVEHTTDCLQWFKQTLVWNECFINKISERYAIHKSFLIQRLFFTVAFHDVGKATINFQNKVRNNSTNLESHALSSVPIIYGLIKDHPILEFEDAPFYPEILSIASHHSKLKKNMFDSFNNMAVEYVNDSFFQCFFECINRQAENLQLKDWTDITFNKNLLLGNPLDVFRDNVLLNLEEDGFRYEKKDIVRDVFLLFKSILHYCDWLASSEKKNYNFSTKDTDATLTERTKQKIKDFKEWQPFQLHAAESGNANIFVQIPTGQGKTEAAALWAVNNNDNQKIIFLLPTMVTTNKMWKRMRFLFGGDENVGLSHSTAQYVLKEKDAEIEPEFLRQHFLYNRTFFKPVTVATVDQLIYTFFNWGHWVLTNLACDNAKIIIDEIHVYDAYTFGILLEVIHCIIPYHSKFAIMSASLPDVLVNEVKKVIPDFELISDPSFDKKQRHVLNISEQYIEHHIIDIKKDYNAGCKVLVVCNTIKKARELYDEIIKSTPIIPINDVMLYHSQFILIDKISKEDFLESIENLEGGFIAICTQIVEVSLDIDFDVLYTENAPIDAIIQRLGRVNRKGLIGKRQPGMNYAKVLIAKESENSRKYVYKDLQKILDNTYIQLKKRSSEVNGNLTECDFKQLVDVIYTRENLGAEYYVTLQEGRNLIHKLWNEYLNKIYTLNIEEAKLQNISSRKSDYITVESVLLKHYREFNFDEAVANNNFELLRKYTIKVPIHIAKKYAEKKLNDSDIYLLDMKYDACQGLSLEPNDENMI